MFKEYVHQYLSDLSLPEEQREHIWMLLGNIKDNHKLMAEFVQRNKEDLIEEEAESEEIFIHAETFFGMDFDLTDFDDDSAPRQHQEEDLGEVEEQSEDESRITETLDIFLGGDQSESLALEQSVTAMETQLSLQSLGGQTPLTTAMDAAERYTDLGLLGKGGMGEVRKVRDNILKRNLAMKIIHLSFVKNKNALSRFIEEAQVGAQLQHPNIVPVHDLGELPDGRFYFTMKQIRGREFTDLIREVHEASTETTWKSSPAGTTFRRLIQIFHTMCETMAFSHSLGVIHRDLKPENVMIGDFGEVLVVDWGIAKVLGSAETPLDDIDDLVQTDHAMATRMGMVAGTPSYMSPEQAMGRVDLVTATSDIYTLGAILYEILCGKPPYTGSSAMEIVEKVKEKRPVSLLLTSFEGTAIEDIPDVEALDEATGKIPLQLIDICERAMKRDIQERYQSTAALAQDISDWLEGAQKRDKALKEYEAGLEKIKEAEKQEAYYNQCWREANQLIQAEGFDSQSGWLRWREGMEARQEALHLRSEYRKSLQDALVYDFTLEEANEAIAFLLLDDIIAAIASGEQSQKIAYEKQFNSYLQQLSSKKQEEIQTILRKKRSDNIVLARARKGGLIGRYSLRREITAALLGSSRLISLVGTAGVGKTRLALELIYDIQQPAVQKYFCDLTAAQSELDVVRFVAKAMDVQLRSIDPIGQLGELFASQRTILVLDKLEQVLAPVKNIIVQWLEQSPSLRIIATSRIRLRITEERSFSIQPLSILEGMELFTKRGQKANGTFSLNHHTRPIVGRLVSQLDYLPLAIELAAARLSLFSVANIEQRLQERFSLLRSREKGTQALQGALDWSWDLLKPWTKAALSQASIFRGGFVLIAAENILKTGSWKAAPAIFDILQDLCDDSLLSQTKSEDGSVRYHLLESIRQYSEAHLKDPESIGMNLSGEIAYQQTGFRHAEYYGQFGQHSFLDELDSQDDQKIWQSFSEELDNFIAGTQYGQGSATSSCCLAALKILGMKGPVSLGIDIATEVIALPSVSPIEKKKLHIIRSRFLRISGRMQEAREEGSFSALEETSFSLSTSLAQLSPEKVEALHLQAEEFWEVGNIEEAESHFEKALELYQKSFEIYSLLKNIKGSIQANQKMGQVLNYQGKFDQAFLKFKEALTLAEKHDFFLLKAEIYSSMGRICRQKSDYEGALELFKKALETCQKLGDRFGEADNLGKLGILYSDLGQYEQSIEQYQLSLKIAQEIGNKRQEGNSLGNLGVVYRNIGDYENALQSFQQAKKIAQNIGNKSIEGGHLGNIGCVYTDLGDFEQAVLHHKEAIDIAREIGDKMNEGINLGNLGGNLIFLEKWREAKDILTLAIEICSQTLPPAAGAFSAPLAWALAQNDQLDEALAALEKGEPMVAVYPLEHGKFLCGKAKVFLLAGEPNNVQEALRQAKEIAVKIKAADDSILPKTIRETETYISQHAQD